MAPDLRDLPLTALALEWDMNLRARIHDAIGRKYAANWHLMPPVTVHQVNGRYLLTDGFYRHAAAALLGKETIRAEVIQGTYEQALDHAVTVRLLYGLPLTIDERKRALATKLRLHPDWSDRRVSKEMMISRDLVGRTRMELIASGHLQDSIGRIGADGKKYRMGSGVRSRQAARPVLEPLALLTQRVTEVTDQLQAEDFIKAYRAASPSSRVLLYSSIIRLAACADKMRKLRIGTP